MTKRAKRYQRYAPRDKCELCVVAAVRDREIERLEWRQTRPDVSEREKIRERISIILYKRTSAIQWVEIWRNRLTPYLRRHRRGEPVFIN